MKRKNSRESAGSTRYGTTSPNGTARRGRQRSKTATSTSDQQPNQARTRRPTERPITVKNALSQARHEYRQRRAIPSSQRDREVDAFAAFVADPTNPTGDRIAVAVLVITLTRAERRRYLAHLNGMSVR
jgi:hypothetical protein